MFDRVNWFIEWCLSLGIPLKPTAEETYTYVPAGNFPSVRWVEIDHAA